ncbi:MAG TPA: glycosyltransferase family 4 protein [Wenzhouxiangellaceae bacterium]|nr:glycosyltransferase family 4 protein [Wenzhouxiangellaceae bacterium]
MMESIQTTLAAWQAALLALAAAGLLTPLMRAYSLRHGLVDQPGARRSHSVPIARGGGLAIGISIVLTSLLFSPYNLILGPFVAGSVIISLLGWRDDHAPLAIRWRLGVQTMAALGAVALLGPVESIRVAGIAVSAAWLWSSMAVIAIVWLMNLFNFMDGSDGLASSQAALSLVLFAVAFSLGGQPEATWLAAVSAGAALGFLFWNWPRASIFLGDSGSLLLGWCVGCLALVGASTDSVSIWSAFIIVSPFVTDATATLCWRLARRERWYTPHADHAYQYLIRVGWSHRKVLLAWILMNGLLVVPATAVVLWKPQIDMIVAAVLAAVLLGVWYVVHFVVAKERVTT